jgi:hypothetical protein
LAVVIFYPMDVTMERAVNLLREVYQAEALKWLGCVLIDWIGIFSIRTQLPPPYRYSLADFFKKWSLARSRSRSRSPHNGEKTVAPVALPASVVPLQDGGRSLRTPFLGGHVHPALVSEGERRNAPGDGRVGVGEGIPGRGPRARRPSVDAPRDCPFNRDRVGRHQFRQPPTGNVNPLTQSPGQPQDIVVTHRPHRCFARLWFH